MAVCPKCEAHELLITINAKGKRMGKCAGGKDNGGCGCWVDLGKAENDTKAETKKAGAQAKGEGGGDPASAPAHPGNGGGIRAGEAGGGILPVLEATKRSGFVLWPF
jgi:hypothetical protein